MPVPTCLISAPGPLVVAAALRIFPRRILSAASARSSRAFMTGACLHGCTDAILMPCSKKGKSSSVTVLSA